MTETGAGPEGPTPVFHSVWGWGSAQVTLMVSVPE